MGIAQITLFILLGVLPDDSVHTRSHDQFDWLNRKKVIDPTMYKLFTNDVMRVVLATLV